MQHPIINNRLNLLLFIALWIFVTISHFLGYVLLNKYPWDFALTDSLVYNTSFSIIALALWFALNFSLPKNKSIGDTFLIHIIHALSILGIWLFGIYILYLSINPDYGKYFIETLLQRILSSTTYYIITILAYSIFKYNERISFNAEKEKKFLTMIKEAELNALKSQINPHFLFNSLNSISSLTLTKPEKAHEMIIKLSDFMRYSLHHNEKIYTRLDQELENAKRYLDIEKSRFENKLNYSININEDLLDFQIPVMILQPIFENAVKHGVYENTEPVFIETIISDINSHIKITIKNNYDSNMPPRKGTGTGLKNIQQRLHLIYNDPDLIKTEKSNSDFIVHIYLPK